MDGLFWLSEEHLRGSSPSFPSLVGGAGWMRARC